MSEHLKILIVKTSSLGDVIHCLPIINDIHAVYPTAQIDWVVETSFADIPRLHTGINEVFTVAVRRWRKALFTQNTWSEIAFFKRSVQKKQYDVIIDAQGLLKSALITKQINGVKHGYNKNSIREPLASYFYDKKHDIDYNQHAVTRNRHISALSLDYATPNCAPDYGLQTPQSHTYANSESHIVTGLISHSQLIGLHGNFIIGLHATSRDSKLWPIQHWIDLGKQLSQLDLYLVLPWANKAEFERANTIASQLKNASVLPKLSIAQLSSVISQSKAAIGVDTGLTHLAAALNIPTIAVYTDTNPKLTGVMGGTIASVTNLGNINQIPSVDQVFNQLKQIL